MKSVLAAFARNTVLANISLLIIFLAGGMAVFSMVRETFPQFSLDMITITVPYPGADPEEVEEGVSRKIEEALEGVEGIKLSTASSAEEYCSVVIEVREDYEVDDLLERVKTKVDSISNFPRDAEKPVVQELVLRDLVALLSLSGPMSEAQIKEWASRTRDEVLLLDQVSQAEIFGARDYEIAIELSEQRMQEYGLTFNMVMEAVRKGNLNMSGGTIRTQGEEIRVRTMGRGYRDKDLASIVVLARPQGEIITLDRIATIKDGFNEDPINAEINGEGAVLLMVYKTKEEDSLKISEAVHDFVERKGSELPETAKLEILFDSTDMLRSRINLLVKNGLVGLCLVFLLLWLFMDIRLSFWAGMGIPISIAGALALLWAMGETINMISLFGLIMVLGIVVDDAIVVGEAIFVHRQQGDGPLQAAVEGVCEVGMPVIAAVFTSIVAFIPLAYIGGIMGKFISIMPVVVIACLVISLLECLFLLPAHLSHLPEMKTLAPAQGRLAWLHNILHLNRRVGSGLTWFINHLYAPCLAWVLRWRYISLSIAVVVLMLTYGVVVGGLLKFEVFPEVDGYVITANLEFANGTPPQVTQEAIGKVEDALVRLAAQTETVSGEPLLNHRLTLVGQELKDYGRRGPHLGGVQAILLESEKRGIHTKDLMLAWEKEVGPLVGVKSLTFQGMSHGPPGDPIEVWIRGENMDHIQAASESLISKLSGFEGVNQIRSDFSPGKNEVRLALKPEARALGITLEDLARQVQAGYYGAEAQRLQRGRDDIRVKVRYEAGERQQLAGLRHLKIRSVDGRQIPLESVANIDYSPGYSVIVRTDGLRRVTVSAGVDTAKANANEILSTLSGTFFDELERTYPGLRVSAQGEQKKMRESFSSLTKGYPLAILGMFVIIATVFRSYIQPFVILFTVPFGIIGGVIGHLLLGYELSMMSMFGMVALTGVVVNDAIVLIERVNANLSQGMDFTEAVLQGGKRRFRAIVLTSLSTIGGLAPLIMETDLQAKFLIPMALSVAAGVAFATLLTLLLIPSLLMILNDFRRLLFWLQKGEWPGRAEVEPAIKRLSSS